MLVTNFKHIRREKTALQTVAMLRRLPSRTKVILLNSVLRTVIDLTPASGIYRYRTWVALLIQFVFIGAARRARAIDDYFSPVISLDILELEHAVLEPSELLCLKLQGYGARRFESVSWPTCRWSLTFANGTGGKYFNFEIRFVFYIFDGKRILSSVIAIGSANVDAISRRRRRAANACQARWNRGGERRWRRPVVLQTGAAVLSIGRYRTFRGSGVRRVN